MVMNFQSRLYRDGANKFRGIARKAAGEVL
jgi:hypothetical protein